jgi:hypothetical protein
MNGERLVRAFAGGGADWDADNTEQKRCHPARHFA